jgi:hypothetical protein
MKAIATNLVAFVELPEISRVNQHTMQIPASLRHSPPMNLCRTTQRCTSRGLEESLRLFIQKENVCATLEQSVGG